ncbi:MAG: OprD family outer membrane porin [Bacteroidota bacterium]|nr:OprD family outer membrane porin [Bacteroidota bacterium]
MLKKYSLVFVMLIALKSMSQHQDLNEKSQMYKGKKETVHDTTSLLSAFKKGHVNGHFRYFFMATDNANGLTDYFANAAGGGLRYETAEFRGFQMAVSGFYLFDIGSSDLGKLDSTTKQGNRYEIGLFDIEDPSNHKDIDRLEELYLRYNYKKSHIIFGRQLINTPFINLQDGRMRPTGVEGVWAEYNETKKLKIEGGWIYAVSPRSTTKWYYAGHSLGVYPSGVNIDGRRSDYFENISSQGVAMLGLTINAKKWMNIKLWNMHFDNVLNTAMLQMDFKMRTKEKSNFYSGIQFLRQDAINDGGNVDPEKTYINRGKKSMVLSGKFGWKNERLDYSINYTHITKHGRYLMPREWGRDPFYTFMPRERNEGYGNVHAVVGKIAYGLPKYRIKTSLAAGYFKLPDVKDFELNKYGMPSYTQINADVRYLFKGLFNGMDAQFLVVGKLNNGELYNNRRFEFNKVNMLNYNLILNFHF